MRFGLRCCRAMVTASVFVTLLGLLPMNVPAQSNVTYEGYGNATRGGEGGDIYHVTHLGDSGPGSLREGILNRSGPRTIVFDVGGTIVLTNFIKLNSPYLTIDGATAPSPGITLTKSTNTVWFIISGTHDVILRHLRFQGLYLRGADDADNDTAFLAIDGDWDPDYTARNIVLDHLTILNATDAALDIWGEVSDVTVSWCLVADNYHPSTVSFYPAPFQRRQRISMHHNVWARNNERNPQLRADVVDFDYVNNIVYDWGHWEERGYGMRIRNDAGEPQVHANIINNYFLPGAFYPTWGLVFGSHPGPDEDGGPALTVAQGTVVTNSAMGKLWVAGNILPAGNVDHFSTISAPTPVPASARVTTYSALELRDWVVPSVGTRYRTPEEEALLAEMAAKMQGSPQLRILSVTPSVCLLELKAPAGFRYDVQFADRLERDAWQSLTNFVATGETVTVISAPSGGNGSRFYRVTTAAE